MKYLFLLIALTFSLSMQAQYKISGQLLNKKDASPLIYYTLLLEAENGAKRGNLSDDKGNFIFDNLQKGNYNFYVLAHSDTLFREKLFVEGHVQKNFSIEGEKTQALNEVSITQKKFEKKADRFVFNVLGTPVAKGNTAFGLLKETPLVSSTDDKSLNILGKSSAIIYINGRKSTMDSESVLQMLKNTNAEDIERIEVITLPGSEYQVESNDGVINIVMKKPNTDGWNGTLRTDHNLGYYYNPSAGLSLNYRKDKLALNFGANAGSYKERQNYILSNGNNSYINQSEGSVIDPNKNLGLSLNADYALSEKQSMGFSYNMRNNQSKGSIFDLYNQANFKPSNRTLNLEDAERQNHSFNLNYEWRTDSLGSKLSSNVSYLYYNRDQKSTNETISLDGSAGKIFRQEVPQLINNVGANIDYILKSKNKNSWLFGSSYNYTTTDNNTIQENLTTSGFVRDEVLSNHFKYNEHIVGLYTSFERSLSEKISLKVGARLEHTVSAGNVVGKTVDFNRTYSNVLPYATANYAIDDSHNLSLAFSSRIRRPTFWELNPSRIYLTPINYIQNNPFMLAAKNYKQELTYMYKGSYFAVLDFNYTNDASSQLPLQGKVINESTLEESDFLRYIRTNYGSNKQLGLTLGMNKSFFKGIWTTNYSFNVQYNVLKGVVTEDPTYVKQNGFTEVLSPYVVDNNNFGFFTQINNNIRLSAKKDWFLGLNFFYLSPKKIEIGELGAIHQLDVSLKKTWNNWTVMFQANDVLGSYREVINGVQPNGNFNNVNQNPYRRQFNLGVNFKFGNQKLKKSREVESANSTIKSRT